MSVYSCRASVTATSARPGSSGPPTLPRRRPRQDHGSGAGCARLPPARGLGHRRQPAVPQFEGFAGRPAAPSSLIEIRLKAGELSSEDFDNASVYHVINGVQIDEIGQLFIYDDYHVINVVQIDEI